MTIDHKINISYEKRSLSNIAMTLHLRRCIKGALQAQGVKAPCEINVLITDDKGIRAINEASRKIDSATDVLSFPMFEMVPGELPEDWEEYLDPDTGLVPLGDMALSMEHAAVQAKEFGHSLKRETGYLTVHSVLHLLGYDHMDDGPMKREMRQREETIMQRLALPR